jgi:gamma-glutamylcyclotransferase
VRLYFAYGSNMCSRRLRERVGEAESRGRAVLDGFRHRFDKRGTDGTGKGNLVPGPRARVYGVAYALAPGQLDRLDEFERGYRRLEVTIAVGGDERAAVTYVALEEMRMEGLAVAHEYIEHYLRGAREHALPEGYVAALAADAGLNGGRRGSRRRSPGRSRRP